MSAPFPWGRVSRALVRETCPGDTVVLGPARGTMIVERQVEP